MGEAGAGAAALKIGREGGVGRVHLDAPARFNALDLEMCVAFRRALLDWAEDDGIAAVLVTAEGPRAFCAGGDVRAFWRAKRGGDPTAARFFRHEYRLNHAIHEFPKPFIALIDGIVMGGGAGISVHGSHRIMSERALFAMPETGIGLFPDVGATEFLARCPGALGMYLGLTGARIKAADAIHAGIGTHFMPSSALPEFARRLASADLSAGAAAVDALAAEFAAAPGPAPIREHRRVIDKCFAADGPAAIVAALEAEDGYFAIETADELRAKSPTSLLVAFRQLREGAGLGWREALRREYRIARACLEGHDFFEGIRAAVIDKDRSPRWDPARLDDVAPAAVDAHFAPRGRELDLD